MFKKVLWFLVKLFSRVVIILLLMPFDLISVWASSNTESAKEKNDKVIHQYMTDDIEGLSIESSSSYISQYYQ